MSPLVGFTRLRKNQIGFQAAFGTPVAAIEVLPLRGVPGGDSVGWTEQDVDTGSLYPQLAPYRGPQDNTQSLTGQLDYNTLIKLLRLNLVGGVTPSGAGTAQTWAFESSGDTADDFDYATVEFGDDAGDAFQQSDGICEALHISLPEGLGAVTVDASMRYGTTVYPETLTAALTVLDNDYHLMYGKDFGLYIDDAFGGIGSSQITDALHSLDLTITPTVDQKRFANASQSFGVSAFGRSAMDVTARFTFAKTADVLAECLNWAADAAVARYISLKCTSVEEAESMIPFSAIFNFPARWYVHEEVELGGNAAVALEGHAFFDPDLYPMKVTVVGTEVHEV